jgi:hypothetical protein
MSTLAALLVAKGGGLEAPDDFDRINAIAIERHWSDGLPVVPPTVERVERMLMYCDRPWDEPIAAMAPRYGEATPLRLAANAVMAGCKDEYLPIVMLAVEALCDPAFNLYAVQATTHSCAPLIVVNGPIAREIGMNAGHSAFGPGGQANATIGRAVRLAMLNIGGAIPGVADMATYGSPAKYTFCAAENEAASPWTPLHVERGFPATSTAVTVIAAEPPHNVNDHESTSAEGVLNTIAGTIATTGSNNVRNVHSDPVVLIGPEHAATIASGGYSKEQVKTYLFEHTRVPLARFTPEKRDRRIAMKPDPNAGPDAMVPIAASADDFIVIVIGGAGRHSAFIPTFGNGRSVTRALKRSDGEYASSITELRAR